MADNVYFSVVLPLYINIYILPYTKLYSKFLLIKQSMANIKVHFSLVLPLICFFLLSPSPLPCNAQTLKTCGLNLIYQLGDSVSDTGNLIREHPESAFAKLPYGETFFKNATGRCSDGLLMIDYFGKHSKHLKLLAFCSW